jgi:hypothetical protein
MVWTEPGRRLFFHWTPRHMIQLEFDSMPDPPKPVAEWDTLKFGPTGQNYQWHHLAPDGSRTGYVVCRLIGLNCPQWPYVAHQPDGSPLGGKLSRGSSVFRYLDEAKSAIKKEHTQ